MENSLVTVSSSEVVLKNQHDLYVSFWLGEELFGINIIDIKEVTSLLDITPIFHAPSEVKGYVNLRGEIHMILDFRHMMGLEPIEATLQAKIIIFKPTIGEPFGILVDRISDVLPVDQAHVEQQALTDSTSQKQDDLISGVCKLEDQLLVMINSKKLLSRG